MSAVASQDLARALRAIFAAPGFDPEAETVKSLKKQVAERLGIGAVPRELKGDFKEIVQRLLNEKEEEGEEEAADGNAPRKSKKTRAKKRAPAPPPASAAYSKRARRLLELGRAMRLGPRLHRGLREMTDAERVAALTERLEEAGAAWRGEVPSSSDVADAAAERRRLDDLDGLDAGLILAGGRRRGRPAVSYAADDGAADEDDEEDFEGGETSTSKRKRGETAGDDEGSDGGDGAPPQKRGGKKGGGSDDDDTSFDCGDSSEAEAEFD